MGERELHEESLRDNKFTRGLVDNFGFEAVVAASLATLTYPARLVSSHKEAAVIAAHLQGEN